MFEVTWRDGEVLKRFTGRVDSQELVRASILVQSDPRFDDLRVIINDLRACDEVLPMEESDQEAMLAQDYGASRSNSRLCVAFLTEDPALASRCQEHIALQPDLVPMAVFGTIEAARAWANAVIGASS